MSQQIYNEPDGPKPCSFQGQVSCFFAAQCPASSALQPQVPLLIACSPSRESDDIYRSLWDVD